MFPSAHIPMAAERSDIHKSCKSIENLLNILNEYCEVAGTLSVLQRKLAKALRETAGLKTTGDVSANALCTSATIFEALSDIDSKFAKVMNKEYDGVSNEVKKWFKKLAREEKAHDERIINANAKIKQAGLAYEKKKKKASDVQDEHARYINLISTLGPEISQESRHHALNVTRRHITTTYSIAACLCRVADAEWQRSCESIRRFSPTVGPLGEWQALCEGGWSGSIPQGLPDLDDYGTRQPQPIHQAVRSMEEDTQQVSSQAQEEIRARTPEFRESTEQQLLPPGGYPTSPQAQHSWSDPLLRNYNPPASGSPTNPGQNPYSAANSVSTPTGLEPPRLPFADSNTGSVRSLSAFPIPPAHFPLPPPRQQPQYTSISQSAHSSNSNLNLPAQSMDSLVSVNNDRSGFDDAKESDRTEHQHMYDNPGSPQLTPLSRERTPERPRTQGREPHSTLPPRTSLNDLRQPTAQAQMNLPTNIRQKSFESLRLHDAKYGSSSSGDTRPSNTRPHSQDDYQDNGREFGMNYNAERPMNLQTSDNPKPRHSLERADTGSSLVAAMRNRFSITSGSTSPPPRDLPRLPLSVNSLASRYEPVDAPLSPNQKLTFSSRQQSLPPVDAPPRQFQEPLYQNHLSTSPESRSALSNSEEQRRGDEPLFSDRRRREQQLIEKRERELDVHTQELERDRLWLSHMREDDENDGRDQSMLRPRERRISLRHQLERRLSQMDLDDIPAPLRVGSPSSAAASPKLNPRSQYSYNTTHLTPPLSPATNTPPAAIHSPHSPRSGQNSQPSSPLQKTGFEETQYGQHERRRFPGNSNELNKDTTKPSTPLSGSSPDYRQLAPLKPQDKTKSGASWIRRFSMPVGNAFNLDSKRHQSNSSVSSTTSNYDMGSGIGNDPVQGGGGSGGRGLFSMDARKNVSTTALRIPGEGGDHVQEDGRLRSGAIGVGRRSYEVAGLRGRSMTNLGITEGRQ